MDDAIKTDPLNIFQRINEVKKKISYIRKDKRVDSYMAVTHDAVTGETRDMFIECGIIVVPHETESKTCETGTVTAKGTPFIRFEAKYRIDFVNIDKPDDLVSVEFTAHALDHGDKAPGKAHSYAVKYAILKILQIETGEHEEEREPQKLPKKESSKTIGQAEMDKLSPEIRKSLTDLHIEVMDAFDPDDPETAYDLYAQTRDNLPDEGQQMAFRGLFPSNVRTAFTKIYNARKESK